MQEDQVNLKRQAPLIVWLVRLCFIAVIYFIGKFWLENGSPSWIGKISFGGFIVVSSAALIASFIRAKTSLALISFSVLAIPLAIFLPMDFLLKGAWWEWYMFAVQMGIPLAVAYYIWKAPRVRNYYFPNQK
jgi:hypothetical protein